MADHTPAVMHEAIKIVESCIAQLDEQALKELAGGYSNDIEQVYDAMLEEAANVLSQQAPDPNNIAIDSINIALEESLRCQSLNYFITTVFGQEVDINWHHLQWGEKAEQFRHIAILAARDHGKCLGKGTPVRMFDGTLKPIEQIKKGDLLMGIDSTPRTVKSTHNGTDQMYRVRQKRAMSYDVNSRHVLHYIRRGEKVNIKIGDYLSKSDDYKLNCYGYRVGFELPYQHITLEPYYLGLWLGDGNNNNQIITTGDNEVIDYLKKYAAIKSMDISIKGFEGRNCSLVRIKNYSSERNKEGRNTKNRLLECLREFNLLHNKHIPESYLYNNKKVRLELLAGLIDSDGYLRDGCYYFSFKDKKLTQDIKRLCDTLGYRCSFVEKTNYVKAAGRDYTIYKLCITGDVHEIPCKIARKKKKPRNDTRKNFQNSHINIEPIGKDKYYGITVDGDSLFLLEDGTVVHNSFFWSHLYPIWMMYRYDRSDPAQRKNNIGKGFIFSHTEGKAIDFLRDIKNTIESNDILRERLFTGQVKGWADKMIHTKNGCELNVKGFRGASRGYHPYWIVADDVLKDETLYSPTQREKATDTFKSVIMQMLIPGGQLVVVGTPFHELDLYSIFRTPEFSQWNYSEYPSIYPDGELLWTERYSYKRLKERRKELGNVIFSREFLCRPISSDSSLFPFELLTKATHGMENYKLVNNIEAFPIKFQNVVTGHDFAKSANVGADYTVFTVWGIDENETYWLLYCWRKLGATFDEQISKIKTMHTNFRPDVMILEKNSFQTIYAEFLQNTSLPIHPHTTGTEKHQMEHGVPGLSVLFERGKFKFPYGDEHSKNIADIFMGEFNSITYTDDKGIQSVAGHDDCVMSTWFGRLGGLVSTRGSFAYEFM